VFGCLISILRQAKILYILAQYNLITANANWPALLGNSADLQMHRKGGPIAAIAVTRIIAMYANPAFGGAVATDNTWVDLSALCTYLGFCAELGSDILAELFNHSAVALTQRVPVARASASDRPQNPHHLRQHQQQQIPGTRHGTRRNNDSNNQTAVTKRRSAGAAVAHRWSDGCSQQPRRGRSGKRRSPYAI
jgi:hypothetical protein